MTWHDEVIGFASIATNCGLIFFTMKDDDFLYGLSPSKTVWLFFLLQV